MPTRFALPENVPLAADELALAEDMAGFAHDPLGHVLYSYPWGEPGTPLAERQGPWEWQRDLLERVGAKLRAGVAINFAEVVQEAVSSGHGVGKSALVAWLIRWALDTCVDTRVMVTANTEAQLRTKTWPELSKWHHLAITSHWWVWTATSYYSADAEHGANWRADAVTWSENNTEAFAGAHNAGKRLVVLFDEASAVADKVWEVTEGALTDANTEILWFVFGNPTQPAGRFRECFRRNAHRWTGTYVDARTVPGTNRVQHEQWIADHGIDSDFVKIRVLGRFPNIGIRGLFSEDVVTAAFGRPLRPDQVAFAPVILACDPAWTGADLLVIGKRQGLWFEILAEIPRNDDDGRVAELLARYEDEFNADAVFIDFGYGTGIASFGKMWGRSWELINFGSAAAKVGYKNKRAEMYVDTRDWLKAGGAIPKHEGLREQLLAIETVHTPDGSILIEGKKELRERIGLSPDHLDCLVLTHARPVQSRAVAQARGRSTRAVTDYNPHAAYDG